MRGLSEDFINDLNVGILAPIRDAVLSDRDLIMEIREEYINVYCKGHNLSCIKRANNAYSHSTHEKFTLGNPEEKQGDIQSIDDARSLVSKFTSTKGHIAEHRIGGTEIEFEQFIIRSNNYEPRNNTEYFILDRQLVEPGKRDSGRPDMTGFFWSRNDRKKNQEVPLVLFEVKFALNPDIKNLSNQLSRYWTWLESNYEEHIQQHQEILRQKCSLGLFGPQGTREKALTTLQISQDIAKSQIIIILVDYNSHSTLFDPKSLTTLPFSQQVRIFRVGFGLWEVNSEKVTADIFESAPSK